jgi:ABC-type multidrug transport system, ATPase component
MLKIQKLNKTYQKHLVLKNVEIELNNNNVVALLGPNGSGKTTLIKTLLGLVIPDNDSELFLFDKKIEYNLSKYLNVGYVPQTPYFPNNLKVKDLIDYLKSFEKSSIDNLEQLIEDLNIKVFLHKKISELSGGMKQKINLLQCFMTKRDIYI